MPPNDPNNVSLGSRIIHEFVSQKQNILIQELVILITKNDFFGSIGQQMTPIMIPRGQIEFFIHLCLGSKKLNFNILGFYFLKEN